jgi:hypothetical protein
MKLAVAILITAFACANDARAALIEYTFTGTFTDAATVGGSFVMDTTSGTPFAHNLSVTAAGSFTARTYVPGNSTLSTQLLSGLTRPTLLAGATDEANRVLRITPTAPLDGTASTVGLDTGNGNIGAVECYNCSPFRALSSGTFALAVPNYSTVQLSLAPTTVALGATVTATVSVTGLALLGTPTGTIDVIDNGVLCSITLPATSCTFAATTAGSTSLLAQYNGDANYRLVLSNLAPLQVLAPAPATPVPGPGGPLAALLAALVGLAAVLGRRR